MGAGWAAYIADASDETRSQFAHHVRAYFLARHLLHQVLEANAGAHEYEGED